MKSTVCGLMVVVLLGAAGSHAGAQDASHHDVILKRYIVERTFPEGLNVPLNREGVGHVDGVVSTNAREHVTWIQSYVSKDGRKTFCVYDAPSEDAIRKVARANGLPVDRITEVRILSPYFYTPKQQPRRSQ